MNYFAHGRRFVDDPYFLAGTAVPDWLNVVDRKVRVRSKQAALYVDSPDVLVGRVAAGIRQHHADDAWFHETRAFAELSLQLCGELKESLAPDEGFRPHFLGHILVEILLDATLITADPARLEAYYAALEQIDPQVIEDAVNRMSVHPTHDLARLIPLFSRERFLSDYADDGKLLFRLNQVMRRVRLPALPESLTRCFSDARRLVAERADELLAEGSGRETTNNETTNDETSATRTTGRN